jgi:predicted kinase
MGKIRLLRGLPASGKSTLAREIVVKDGNSARVNRDDLRAMLFNSKWSGPREGIVIECEKAIAEVLLRHKHTPIIDDTNLTDRHWDLWKNFATEHEAVITQTTLTTPIDECVVRDRVREKSVGEAVIYRLALEAGWIDFGTKPIVLVDIDGTLADGTHREKFVVGVEKKDWKSYYERLLEDTPIEHIVRWVNELHKDHTVCIVSGRPDTYQKETLKWLRWVAGVKFDYIFMRRGSDKREDSIIKSEILTKLPKAQIDLVIDDRPRVISMWRENGLRVVPVKGACENL